MQVILMHTRMPSKTFIKLLIPSRHYAFFKKVYNYLISLAYIGNNFECVFCRGRFHKFLPNHADEDAIRVVNKFSIVGFGFRLNCWCPRCLSFERERLIYLYLLHFTNIFSNKVNLLILAPEPNLDNILIKHKNIHYISADLHRNSIMIKLDIQNISLKDNLFDYIICNHVLNFVKDDIRAISELYRILMPGGLLLVIVPISLTLTNSYEDARIISKRDRKRAFGDADILRIYGRDFGNRLETGGFLVEEFNWENYKEIFGGDSNKFGLLKGEKIFICRKPKY